ncbi:MAG: hypothetical protein LBO78_03000 [Rickettsiales bacterium]|nr:hypothetical protein [Rickettsiales bacterium]
MRKTIAMIFAMLISGCGSIHDTDPVGVGYDANELKLSPCACIQVETKPGLPEWFIEATI